MKWWTWIIVGFFVMVVTSVIGIAMYKRSKRGNPDSLEKAREAKEEKRLEKLEETKVETAVE